MPNNISLRKRLALEVFRKFRENKKKLHPLRQLFWECTLRCNIQCKHCGSDCKSDSLRKDMPAKDFLKVIDSITPHINPNETNIIISGGEPLMRKDLEYVGLELYNRGYPWGMVSNGLFLTRKKLDALMAAGLHSITISLDGFKDDHNWMRGHAKSFDQAWEAIRMIVHEPELKWDVVTCVNRKNLTYLPELKAKLYNIGVRNWRVFTIFPVGRAAQYPEFQLTDEEFTNLMEFIKATRKEGKVKLSYGCEGFLGRYEADVRDNFFICNAGISVASILADGSISACPSIRSNFAQGNIYKDNFMDVWNNRFQVFRNREWMRKDECANCNMFRYCEGNGMHLRDDEGKLLLCHYKRIK
ncbi:TIGR04133 family radical SAM/SPASM protein [Bacteroides sp. 519]|uniref:TIGR04133 family radical SAM/SPASM protein n=1 Tax=Bacteroides sp. 519 TaxID=2302937 RepID=UPI0013D19EC5|nr:TIGR04133 family radical SAM/SPASM protein [Bacteroides sp. 519]NDV57601.1 radical SAM protein [Bacteroides sp. 519]